jgi:hypothetical protein
VYSRLVRTGAGAQAVRRDSPEGGGDPDSSTALDKAYDIKLLMERWRAQVPSGELKFDDDRYVNFDMDTPFVARMRLAPDGPYIVAPDSADWIPPDMLTVPDVKKVEEKTRRKNHALDAEGIANTDVAVPRAVRTYLQEAETRSSRRLLELLDRGLEVASPEADAIPQPARQRRPGRLLARLRG